MKKGERSKKPKRPRRHYKKKEAHSRNVKQKVIVNVSGGGSGGGGGYIPFPQQSSPQPLIQNFTPSNYVDTPFRTMGEKLQSTDLRRIIGTQTDTPDRIPTQVMETQTDPPLLTAKKEPQSLPRFAPFTYQSPIATPQNFQSSHYAPAARQKKTESSGEEDTVLASFRTFAEEQFRQMDEEDEKGDIIPPARQRGRPRLYANEEERKDAAKARRIAKKKPPAGKLF